MKVADLVFKNIQRTLKENGGRSPKSLERLRILKDWIYRKKEFTLSEIDLLIELDNITSKLPSTGDFTRQLDDTLHGMVYRQLYILFYKFLHENEIYEEFMSKLYDYRKAKSLKSYIINQRQTPFYFVSNAFPWGYSPNYDWYEYDTMWTEYLVDFMNKEITRQPI